MGTGFEGTFVISWSQTETEGLPGALASDLSVGATWRWAGQAVRVDGPNDLAVLSGAVGEADLHKRAAHKLQRMIGDLVTLAPDEVPGADEDALLDQCFVVTDGVESYTITWIDLGGRNPGLALFLDKVPPARRDLWIVRIKTSARAEARAEQPEAGGVICFTTGTLIATPDGPRPVEALVEGDLVVTKDDGVQPVVWRGAKRMSGARLYAMPKLRPIRIRAGALGIDRPDGDLLVSPGHRLLVEGPAARALFNETEVLIRAEDLLSRPGVAMDMALNEVTYVHLLFDRHQILFANGVESESFHPAEADMGKLDPTDRARLIDAIPGVEEGGETYGVSARRNLTGPEAAILTSDVVTI